MARDQHDRTTPVSVVPGRFCVRDSQFHQLIMLTRLHGVRAAEAGTASSNEPVASPEPSTVDSRVQRQRPHSPEHHRVFRAGLLVEPAGSAPHVRGTDASYTRPPRLMNHHDNRPPRPAVAVVGDPISLDDLHLTCAKRPGPARHRVDLPRLCSARPFPRKHGTPSDPTGKTPTRP